MQNNVFSGLVSQYSDSLTQPVLTQKQGRMVSVWLSGTDPILGCFYDPMSREKSNDSSG